jgi:prolyl 4-hydroxylase
MQLVRSSAWPVHLPAAPLQDYFFHKEGVNNGGNRYATVLTYLNDVEEGGETVSDLRSAASLQKLGSSAAARLQ